MPQGSNHLSWLNVKPSLLRVTCQSCSTLPNYSLKKKIEHDWYHWSHWSVIHSLAFVEFYFLGVLWGFPLSSCIFIEELQKRRGKNTIHYSQGSKKKKKKFLFLTVRAILIPFIVLHFVLLAFPSTACPLLNGLLLALHVIVGLTPLSLADIVSLLPKAYILHLLLRRRCQQWKGERNISYLWDRKTKAL